MELSKLVSVIGFLVASSTASAELSTRVKDNSTAILSNEDCNFVIQESEKNPSNLNLQTLRGICIRQNGNQNPNNSTTGEDTPNNDEPHNPSHSYPSNWQVEQEITIDGVRISPSQLPPGVNANTIKIGR